MNPISKSPGVSFTLLRCGDEYVFQHRDDLPNITAPALFAGFGGAIEGSEDPRQAAARELSEETSLKINGQDLEYLGFIDSKEVTGRRYVYLAEIDSVKFEVYEGQGKVVFTKAQLKSLDMKKFTYTTRTAIRRYILSSE